MHVPVCTSCGVDSPAGFRFCGACGAPLADKVAERELRKTVTVLFCDLTGSTAMGETLDAERVRAVLSAYFERMKAIVERYGGRVEKFIGDAVVAVFGVPVLHEDDALRAIRAAVEMRAALSELGLVGRIGVTTGEVVTGSGEALATGDTLNVAARLQQAAVPGEVLVGGPTLEMVGDAVVVEPAGALDLKGKARPVDAHRLVEVRELRQRPRETRFVGRVRELAVLGDAWDRVCAERRCELVTVVGEAGVGKSRLVEEFLHSIDPMAVRGRCLPYGDGITYWPVVEVLKQLDTVPGDPAVAAPIHALLGKTSALTSGDDVAWAFRKTLEQAASGQPLVVVFDDIQWGEQTFLDLVEHVALLSSGAAILLVCMARPELTERRSGWPAALRLDGLGDADVDALIPAGVPDELRGRIARAAGGHPLFVEEMVAVASGSGEVVVPASLRALIGARLDQLDPAERSVLERAAVEGEVFHRGAVQALAPDEMAVTPRLAALARHQLIRPDRAQVPGEDGFRFRHLLIRDAAYESLPKAARADLHARFAAWLERRGADLVEVDEILGYHLEQACSYRAELGIPDESGELAAAARTRLTAAGRRARLRDDLGAAAALFDRAAALAPEDTIDLGLEVDRMEVLFWAGRTAEARGCAHTLEQRAVRVSDRVAELSARLEDGMFLSSLDPEGAADRLVALIDEALPEIREAGSDLGLYVASKAQADAAETNARMDAKLEAQRHAVEHARRAGLAHLSDELLTDMSGSYLFGSTPVGDLLVWLDKQEAHLPGNPSNRAWRAGALAMLGRFDEAREIIATLRRRYAEQRSTISLAFVTAHMGARVEMLAEDYAAAVTLGREGCALFGQTGERGIRSTAVGILANALYGLGRLEEADAEAARAAHLGSSDDAATQMLWRRVAAKVLARRGRHTEAEELARQALAIAERTDLLDAQADAYADLAEVLALGGNAAGTTAANHEALDRYARKGNLVMSQRIRLRLTPTPTTQV